jgi:hypothetical protein
MMWLDLWLGGQTLTPEIFSLLEDFEKGKEACGTSQGKFQKYHV